MDTGAVETFFPRPPISSESFAADQISILDVVRRRMAAAAVAQFAPAAHGSLPSSPGGRRCRCGIGREGRLIVLKEERKIRLLDPPPIEVIILKVIPSVRPF